MLHTIPELKKAVVSYSSSGFVRAKGKKAWHPPSSPALHIHVLVLVARFGASFASGRGLGSGCALRFGFGFLSLGLLARRCEWNEEKAGGSVSRSRAYGKKDKKKRERTLTSPRRLLLGSRLLSLDPFLKRLVVLALTFMFFENLTHSPREQITPSKKKKKRQHPPTQTRSALYPVYSPTCSTAPWSKSL